MAGFWNEQKEWADLFLEECAHNGPNPTMEEYTLFLQDMLASFMNPTDARENLMTVWLYRSRGQSDTSFLGFRV